MERVMQEENMAGEGMRRFNAVIIETQLSHTKLFYSVVGYFSPCDTPLMTASPQLPFICPCVVWLLKKKKSPPKTLPPNNKNS